MADKAGKEVRTTVRMDKALALEIEERLEEENDGLLGRAKRAKEDFICDLVRRGLSFGQSRLAPGTKGPLTNDDSRTKIEMLPVLNREEVEWAKRLLTVFHGAFVELANAATRDRLPAGETSTDQLRKMAQLYRKVQIARGNPGGTEATRKGMER